MVRGGSKNGHQKGTFVKEIGLHVQKYANQFMLNSQDDFGGGGLT